MVDVFLDVWKYLNGMKIKFFSYCTSLADDILMGLENSHLDFMIYEVFDEMERLWLCEKSLSGVKDTDSDEDSENATENTDMQPACLMIGAF